MSVAPADVPYPGASLPVRNSALPPGRIVTVSASPLAPFWPWNVSMAQVPVLSFRYWRDGPYHEFRVSFRGGS
ncbi:MAG: hypothetical protein ABI349_03090 [Casimicrobiaceae bacterium]